MGVDQHLILARYMGDRALESIDGLTTYFALQRRHEDGRRWVELRGFATRQDAEAALEILATHGGGERHDLRVSKVTRDT